MSPTISPVRQAKVGYSQLALSVGISYVAVILPRFVRGKCPKDNLGVTLKVALGDLRGDPFGGKEGKRGAKIESMSKAKSSLVLEKGRFKHTRHY